MGNQYRQSNYKTSTWGILAAVHSVQQNINESLIDCEYLYIKPGHVWAQWIWLRTCGDPVLAADYRWLAGFWISFLRFPLNVFTPFEVMSTFKYLGPLMFNHGCLRSRNLFFLPFLPWEGGDKGIAASRRPSKSRGKSGGVEKVAHVAKGESVKTRGQAAGAALGQSVGGQAGPDGTHSLPRHWIWSTALQYALYVPGPDSYARWAT